MTSLLLTAITTAFLLITLVFIMDIHRTIKQLNHNMYRLNKKIIFLITGSTIIDEEYPYQDEETEDMKDNNVLNIDDYF